MIDSVDRNIVLIGYRGCGKTTVGRLLAKALGRPFVDTDEEIAAAAGMSIADIFTNEGETGFRRREADIVARVSAKTGLIVAVGGGAVLDPANVEHLRRTGTIVWLTAPPDVLWQRIQADKRSSATRPDLTESGGKDEVTSLLARRAPVYQTAADLTVDASHRSPPDIAEAIQSAVAALHDASK